MLTSSHSAHQGNVSKACRYSRLALRIFEKYGVKEWQTRVVLTIYGSVYPLKHPYRKLLEPLKAAHRVGLVFGDLHVSFACNDRNSQAHAPHPVFTVLDDKRRYLRRVFLLCWRSPWKHR
jgi:hypothetical protein